MIHEELREELAALAHEQWSGWMRYLFSKCQSDPSALLIPSAWERRWKRQMNTPYADLSDAEKESDRKEADRVLAALRVLGGAPDVEYYGKAIGLVADELERLTPETWDARRDKLLAILRHAAARLAGPEALNGVLGGAQTGERSIREKLHPSDPTYSAEPLEIEEARALLAQLDAAELAAALAVPRPQKFTIEELLGALDVLYKASHEEAVDHGKWLRPNRAQLVIQTWLTALAVPREPDPQAWQLIETYVHGERGDIADGVLIACEGGLVGEAYFNPKVGDGTWWWAGTMDGEYADSAIFSTITHWRPLPDPPALAGRPVPPHQKDNDDDDEKALSRVDGE